LHVEPHTFPPEAARLYEAANRASLDAMGWERINPQIAAIRRRDARSLRAAARAVALPA